MLPAPDAPSSDFVVAFSPEISTDAAREAVRAAGEDAAGIEVILDRAPLLWIRVRSPQPRDLSERRAAIEAQGAHPRYVASAVHPSLDLAPAWAPTWRIGGSRHVPWREPPIRPSEGMPTTEGMWFHSDAGGGVAVDRDITGTGTGARLAVIDDDAIDTDALGLDAEVLVGVERAARNHRHGTRMVAWATGAPGADPPFAGIAPGASRRLYFIPKAGNDVVSLALAIVRATDDGADVIVCATYMEGAHGPLLDDALSFATRLGRGGRGAFVVFPTGREAGGPPASRHASFSLWIADPASDPRVHAVGPSAKGGGWFFYRDRKGLSRPFANRGPFVRWLAPGDDMAEPIDPGTAPLCHAESSGASAVAAGVALLVIANNPRITASEVAEVLTATATPVPGPVDPRHAPFADAEDAQPTQRDADGHNPKHGYGQLHAARAVASVADPIAAALVAIGEPFAARRWIRARRSDPTIAALWSPRLAGRAARWLMRDATFRHAVLSIVRHVRLLTTDLRRLEELPPGGLVRAVRLLGRMTAETLGANAPRAVKRDLEAFLGRVAAIGSAPESLRTAEMRWVRVAKEMLG